jgi:hypothetical protein
MMLNLGRHLGNSTYLVSVKRFTTTDVESLIKVIIKNKKHFLYNLNILFLMSSSIVTFL